MFHALSWLLAVRVGIQGFMTWLNLRQLRALNRKTPSKEAAKIMESLDEYKKAMAYNREKLKFGMFQQAIVFVIELTVLLTMKLRWTIAGEVMKHLPEFLTSRFPSEVQQIVMGTATGWIFLPIMLAFQAYGTFVIEEKWGFNKTTLKTFVKDQLKGQAIGIVIGLPINFAQLYLLNLGLQTTESFDTRVVVATASGFYGAMMLVTNILSPLIRRCFNKCTDVEKEGLRQDVEALCKKIGFPLKALRQMDGSIRSTHGNAFLSGFCGAREIILLDTLVQKQPNGQIVAILAHELGHWTHWHILQKMFIGYINTISMITCFVLSFRDPTIYSAFGFDQVIPAIGLLIFSNVMTPINVAIRFAVNYHSRKCEYEADQHAVKLGFGEKLIAGLIQLNVENKGVLDKDHLFSIYMDSHPTLAARIKAIRQGVVDLGAKEKKDL